MQRHRFVRLLIAAGLVLGITGAAQATTVVTATRVNLRAGPATTYPLVVAMPAQVTLVTYGCTPGYTWCDVAWGGHRGWVSATYIRVVQAQRLVVLTPVLAPSIGLTVVHFDHGYWERHYVGRPWYPHWPSEPSVTVVHRGATACNDQGCAHTGRTVVRPAEPAHRSTTACNGHGCVRVDRSR